VGDERGKAESERRKLKGKSEGRGLLSVVILVAKAREA
jgi:hypothetical protein